MEDIIRKIQESIEKNLNIIRNKTIVVYGCTVFSKAIYEQLQKNNINLAAFVDNDRGKAGKKYLGVMVYRPQEYLCPFDTDKLIIVCSVHEEEMLISLKNMGYEEDNVLHISQKEHVHHVNSIEFMNEEVKVIRQGVGIYERLVSGYEKNIKVFVAPKASGDVFIACSYLKEYCNRNAIENYMIISTSRNLLDIVDVYDIKCDVHIISTDEETYLLRAYMFLGDSLNIKLLAEWVLRTRNSYFPHAGNSIIFEDKFKYEIFNLDKETEPQPPQFDKSIDNDHYNIIKDKSIIISPYAYSSPAPVISVPVWEEIVNRLILKGYKVYTVGYGEQEQPLKNTERIQFSYKESGEVLKYAGGFLAGRSGLCDIVRSADCRQLIIYGRNIRMPEAINIYSLQKAYKDFKGREIVYDDYEKEAFIETVVDYFIRRDER